MKNTTKSDPLPVIYTTLPSVLLSSILLRFPLNENLCWLKYKNVSSTQVNSIHCKRIHMLNGTDFIFHSLV
jgi:hypothetical protein